MDYSAARQAAFLLPQSGADSVLFGKSVVFYTQFRAGKKPREPHRRIPQEIR
jgi:hypothetical protein